jgi:hypothetical protein
VPRPHRDRAQDSARYGPSKALAQGQKTETAPKTPMVSEFSGPRPEAVECLAKLILFGEGSLRKALDDHVAHYHHERNHQGKGNAVLAPRPEDRIGETTGSIHRRKRRGGLLNFYYRRAG